MMHTYIRRTPSSSKILSGHLPISALSMLPVLLLNEPFPRCLAHIGAGIMRRKDVLSVSKGPPSGRAVVPITARDGAIFRITRELVLRWEFMKWPLIGLSRSSSKKGDPNCVSAFGQTKHYSERAGRIIISLGPNILFTRYF